MTQPLLSLCMIVRNEAELLPRFIKQVKGLWDELCVIDTGSTDSTVALLREAGARVESRPWDDDFSAARNASLALAQGEWILYLDADEMVSASTVDEIRAVLTDNTVGAASLRMRNQMPHGHVHEDRLVRLFRAHPTIRFRYRIHEDALPDILDQLRQTGRQLITLSGVIDHLGYTRERAAGRNKKERDLRILNRCLEEDSRDYYSRFRVLDLARFWNDSVLLKQAAQDTSRMLETPPGQVLFGSRYGGELIAIISQGLFPADPKGALAYMDGWADRVDPSASFHLRRGELHEMLGDMERARAEFTTCLGLRTYTQNVQLATTRPLLGLARVDILSGKLDSARQQIDAVLAENPLDLEGLLAAVIVRKLLGGVEGLEAFVKEYTEKNGDTSELHQVLGEQALIAGDGETAVKELRLAAGTPPSGDTGIRLAQALMSNGEIDAARSLATAISVTYPEAMLGVLVCNLIEGKDSSMSLDMEIEAASRALASWIETLKRSKKRELLEAFKNYVPAVLDTFPWVTRLLEN